jgi:peroxiredoxin
MLCREQVAQLREALDQIRALGAELVVIGNGQPHQARAFREERDLRFPLLVDPELRAYRAAGLRRGVASTLGPKALAHGLRALRKGYVQGRTQGDPWQLGGVFVIAPGGQVAFSYVSREAGDHPEVSSVLAALRRLRSRAGGAAS